MMTLSEYAAHGSRWIRTATLCSIALPSATRRLGAHECERTHHTCSAAEWRGPIGARGWHKGARMIVDFQHHYTPPELMDNRKGAILTRLNANQDPILRLTSLLADLPAHVRMMDQAGIDAAVLSCLQG